MSTVQQSKSTGAPALKPGMAGNALHIPAEDRVAIIRGLILLRRHATAYARQKGLEIATEHDLVCRVLHLCTEAAELAEALRCGNSESPNIAGFSHAEEELADVILVAALIGDAAEARLGEAALAKIEACSASRPFRHGKLW